MDGDDLELFERSLRHAVDNHTGTALDRALDGLGWPDAMVDDPRPAIATLFELQGAANVTSSALDHVVTGALRLEHPTTTGVVLPPIDRWGPPGTVDGGHLHVTGLATAALIDAPSLVVVAANGDQELVVTLPTSALTLRRVEGMDPSLGLLTVRAEGVRIPSEPEIAAGSWVSAVAAARLAVAHELVGVARRMLELACAHALERVQFGRPIGSFQAVRHRLADTLVAVEMAVATLDAAWLDGSADAAAMAKSTAGRQARTAARHAQQVLAGIGFTTEHPLHRYVRRTFVLDGLFGSTATLTTALGRQLIASQQLPPLLPL